MNDRFKIEQLDIAWFDRFVEFIDSVLSVEGFGFCNKMQIKSEMKRKNVIALFDTEKDKIVGGMVGLKTVYNLAVDKTYRGFGLGRMMMDYVKPQTIRVKSTPTGHLSKKQRDNFVGADGFYESCGYKFVRMDCSRNFYAGERKGENGEKKRIHIKKGKPHIKIFKKNEYGENLPLFKEDV